ncbi:MAG: TIGR00730 family Rossman fold protein [Candidatus Margulisbacteria bacterium]|nr:TIGR00730 family Rossman fold protein [Candidatus Margulisiibacteriota bacterium]MBU1022197.1 TIGR00730 family Rossman fold protein [Candidatus Margulisiibacteriota bacterium]MBU1729364.1 TIGR00730 family Rossman fold protein [Candidatus Margulisiibacteriota bacterium]MBU1955637.1 TIGR00730 family Rossman fold protein [Candidatus Margulisiibacteriota bacterium]
MKKYKPYSTGDPLIDNEIKLLANKYSHTKTQEFFRQLFTTIIKLHLDHAETADLHLINTTLKELRHAFRVFTPYRSQRKIAVFGSHRISRNSHEYKLSEEFCREIAKRGFLVITGGGGGIMEAGNKGAGEKSFAAKIRIAAEQLNPYIPKGEKVITFNYFFNRKLIFIKESDATVLFPGGFGTQDEGFEVLTLLQTGKCTPRPIIMMENKKGYWKFWLKFIKDKLIKGGFLTKEDLTLFSVVKNAKDAIAEIENFYRVYHSIRYSKDLTIVRLNRELSPAAYKTLNQKFKDILTHGTIQPCQALPIEKKNGEHPHLPRLQMYFNQKSFTRLQQFVKELNTL